MLIMRYDGQTDERPITPDWRTWLYRAGFLRVRLVPISGAEHQLMLEIWKCGAWPEWVLFQPPLPPAGAEAVLLTGFPDLPTIERFVSDRRAALKASLLARTPTPGKGPARIAQSRADR